MKLSKAEKYLAYLRQYETEYEIREISNPKANRDTSLKLKRLWTSMTEGERKTVNEEVQRI